MAGASFRDTYGFDPDDYNGTGGGLPGMLWRTMQQQGVLQPGVAAGSSQPGAPGYDPGDDDSPQGGLLGRLLALHAEQSQYQPSPAGNGQSPFDSQSQNPSQGPAPDDTSASDHQAPLRRIYIYPRRQDDVVADAVTDGPEATADPSNTYSPDSSATHGPQGGLSGRLLALQAEQRRYQPILDGGGDSLSPQAGTPTPQLQSMSRGMTNSSAAQLGPLDPIDIAKSLGIGAANGVVNTLGLPADAMTGFGHFPEHLIENPIRRMVGYPDLPPGQPGYVDELRSDALRRYAEGYFGQFYQPKSRAGRYAETIGEMVPMVAGGEASSAAALRQLPGTLLKHAVAPGVAVQTLEEAFPESKAGKDLQKVYPVARRAIPYVPAATRYLAKRIVPF